MAQGNYSESQFLLTSTAPPDGGVWLWVDQVRGKVKWVKLSHVTHDGHQVENLVQQLKQFSLDLTTPRDINNSVLPKPRQDWTIASQTHYRDLGYTLFRIDFPLSSRAVNSADGGTFSGAGFSFMASGNAIWYASGSGTALNPTLATGVTGSIPHGYFPKTTSYPREQFFRAYGQTQWFTEDGVATTNMGQITDPNNSFRNGRTEVNNTPNSSTAHASDANTIPFFMNASNSVYNLSESQILDLAPTPPGPPPPPPSVDIAQIYFSPHPNSTHRGSTVDQLCNQDAIFTTGPIGQGMMLDIQGSQALILDSGKYRIRSGTAGSHTDYSEITRQVNHENRVWGAESLRTSGPGRNTSGNGGNYLINASPLYGSIQGGQKAVASLESSSDGRIRLNRITYCSNVPPTPTFNITRMENFVSGNSKFPILPNRSDAGDYTTHCGQGNEGAGYASTHRIQGTSLSNLFTHLIDQSCVRNRLNPEGIFYPRIWYRPQSNFTLRANNQTLTIRTSNTYLYLNSSTLFIRTTQSNPTVSTGFGNWELTVTDNG